MKHTIVPCHFQFSAQQFATMLELQDSANDSMAANDWKLQSFPFYRAGFIECAEAITHLGYKWWKKEESDTNQVILELVDILHFALSDVLTVSNHCDQRTAFADQVPSFIYAGDYEALASGEATYLLEAGRFVMSEVNIEHGFHVRDVLEQIALISMMRGRVPLTQLYLAFELMDVTPDRAFAMYCGKNVLNRIRMTFGQKSGAYLKIWDGKEDNVHLAEYIERQMAAGDKFDIAKCFCYLSDTYRHLVLGEEPVEV